MLQQEVKLIFRGLKKQIGISFINIFGLAIGFTFVILAGAYAFNEMSFDRFHKNHKSIYRVEWNTSNMENCSTPGIMGSWIKEHIPEVVLSTRILNEGGGLSEQNIIYNQTKYNIDNPLIVDYDFFKMFSFGVLAGEVKSFEKDKYSVALSKLVADRIFGSENPIGKVIEYKGKMFSVIAVMDEVPQNSSIKFGILLPSTNMPDYVTMDWKNNTLQTFIMSDKFATVSQLQQKIGDEIAAVFNSLGIPEIAKNRKYQLNPLDEIYYSTISYDNLCVHGNKKLTLMLMSLVSIVLLIALLNYANTILSDASRSIKTVGIRSVHGSSRKDNIRFIVYQAALPCIIAIVFAFLISYQIKNVLSNFLNIDIPDLNIYYFIITLVIGALTGALMGLFPAIKFTSYKITSSLKESYKAGKKVNSGGRLFSIAQFVASIVLLISVFTIYKQIDFVLKQSSKNLHDEEVVFMPIANRTAQKSQNIKEIEEALKRLPEVEEVSTSLHIPGDERYSDLGGIPLVKNGEEKLININYNMVGADYPKTMGFEIAKGRLFEPNNKSDYLSYIVNEAFIEKFSIQEISNTLLNGSPIIGVIKDFYYNSLHSEIEPLAIRNEEMYQSKILVKLVSSEVPLSELMNKIKKASDEIDNTAISSVQFLDQHIAKLYEKEVQISKILFVLALFSIIISGMGLFSMSMLISKIRTKEIGIRKVNGAKISEVMIMLIKKFAIWIGIAFLFAIPIAYYSMNKWLENFAYKTSLSWWIFGLAGFLALAIALLTVSWQSWRAASRNPVESLRYE